MSGATFAPPPGWLAAVLADEVRWHGGRGWPRPRPGAWHSGPDAEWVGAWGSAGIPAAIAASGRLLPDVRR